MKRTQLDLTIMYNYNVCTSKEIIKLIYFFSSSWAWSLCLSRLYWDTDTTGQMSHLKLILQRSICDWCWSLQVYLDSNEYHGENYLVFLLWTWLKWMCVRAVQLCNLGLQEIESVPSCLAWRSGLSRLTTSLQCSASCSRPSPPSANSTLFINKFNIFNNYKL